MGEFSSSEEEVEEEQVRVSRDDLRVDFINLYRLWLNILAIVNESVTVNTQ